MRLLLELSDVLPLVTVGVTFRAGRGDEPAGRDGLARVTAKMVRRVSGGGDEMEHALDRIGAELGEQVGLGYTTFGCEVLARGVDAAVELLAERLAAPCDDGEELSKVVRRARAGLVQSRDDDGLLGSRALRRHLFAGHLHGKRVLGSAEGLDTITSTDVRDFAATHYTRENAIVHISGDISVEQAERTASRLTKRLPAGEALPYTAEAPPVPTGRRLVIVDKEERSQTQLGVGTLGVPATDDAYVPLLVANAAFGGTFTSRLTKEIRSERGWSYGATSHLNVGRVREAFTMWTAPSAEDAADCLALKLELLEAWREDGITAAELAQCKSFLLRSYAFEIDTPFKRLQQQVEREQLDLAADFHDRYIERLEAVTLEQANDAVRTWIAPADLWIAAVGDAASLRGPLEEAIGDVAETVVEGVEVA